MNAAITTTIEGMAITTIETRAAYRYIVHDTIANTYTYSFTPSRAPNCLMQIHTQRVAQAKEMLSQGIRSL